MWEPELQRHMAARSCPDLGGGYHSTAPSSAPFYGRSGHGDVCHALDNPHRMITRGKTGFRVVPDHLVLTAMTSSPTSSPIPSSARAALVVPHWCAAMEEEYRAPISNWTWELVPQPQGSNVITGKWVFKHKLHADGTLDCYKAASGKLSTSKTTY
jgi:hypothetical protein